MTRFSIIPKRFGQARIITILLLGWGTGFGPCRGQTAPPPTGPASATRPALRDASKAELATLGRLQQSSSWPQRAVAILRMERYGDAESLARMERFLDDPAWQVRCFAIRSLARRRAPAREGWFSQEQEPRVIRTALRHRYPVMLTRLERGMRFLTRSNGLEEKMLGAEIGAASGNEELVEAARETARTIILRMNREEAGALSPRLAVLTGQRRIRRSYRWVDWLRKKGRRFEVRPGYALGEGTDPLAPPGFAELDSERFAALEDYMTKLDARKLDLAICLDCTSSMWGEIAEAQGGLDDMMLFLRDVLGTLRVGIVAYRDRREEFESKGWDFTEDVDEARRRLFSLTAEGGGDTPEAVYPALKLAYQQFTWMPEHDKTLVLVGDAPPHIGLGVKCAQLAAIALDKAELATHVIQADGKDVKHFATIAESGGGKCVTLEEDDSLMAEIAGLTLGDAFEEEFREFFQVYLELCR